MPTDTPNTNDDRDSPTLRQRLHAATGDRHAEAEALADRAGDAVGENDAEIAVRAAHGDIELSVDGDASAQPAQSDFASVADAENARDHESD